MGSWRYEKDLRIEGSHMVRGLIVNPAGDGGGRGGGVQQEV